MYVGRSRLCVCLCVSVPRRILTLLHRPRCNLGEWQRCPLVVQYWLDLPLVHGFRCYDNRRTLQCKHISIDVTTICTTPSRVFSNLGPIFTAFSQVQQQTCPEREMLVSACSCSVNWFLTLARLSFSIASMRPACVLAFLSNGRDTSL